jgi:hypothetical protein
LPEFELLKLSSGWAPVRPHNNDMFNHGEMHIFRLVYDRQWEEWQNASSTHREAEHRQSIGASQKCGSR